jgi:hypothetical protein
MIFDASENVEMLFYLISFCSFIFKTDKLILFI